MINTYKYPKAKRFLARTGMTVDEALEFLKDALEHKEGV